MNSTLVGKTCHPLTSGKIYCLTQPELEDQILTFVSKTTGLECCGVSTQKNILGIFLGNPIEDM